MLPLGLFVVAVVIVFGTHWMYRWRNPKCKGILPPGTSGLPIIGETLQFIIPQYSLQLSSFVETRIEKYGPIFRTNVLGRHMIISTDAEVNNFLFQQEGKLVEMWNLDSFSKLLSTEAYRPEYSEQIHKYFRGLTLHQLGADAIKKRLLPEFEEFVNITLQSWSTHDSIEVKSSSSAMFLQILLKLFFSCEYDNSQEFVEKFETIPEGFLSIPLNIPGTTYHKVLKDKADLTHMILEIIRDRLASPKNYKGDILDHILEDMKKEEFITEDFIALLLIGLIFAASHTISWTLTIGLKFLSENPSALRDLMMEHEEVIRKRQSRGSFITWEEYKSMTFTLQVINEIVRLGFSIPGVLRRAKKDVEIKGYTIPADWGIMISTKAMHLNPTTFANPLEFNPWRMKEVQQDVTCKNFVPFGGGTRLCPGAEYAKTFLCVVFHVLITNYSWRKTGGGDIVQNPMLRFKNGLRIKVTKKHA